MFESVNACTDARMPARVPSYKLTVAFGSGELKSDGDIEITSVRPFITLSHPRRLVIIEPNLVYK